VTLLYILAFWSCLRFLTAPLSQWCAYITASTATSYGSWDSISTPHQRDIHLPDDTPYTYDYARPLAQDTTYIHQSLRGGHGS
jgi:hypothetical protein